MANHLEGLSLSGSALTDLSPLASLYNLTSLSIDRTSIRDTAFLAGLVSLPFGNSSPFTAEVFFVSKQDILDIKWGTARPIQMQDPAYNVVIPLRAFGQYEVTIDDSRLFLEKSVGTAQSYTTQDLMQYFHAVVGSRIADELAGYLLRNP